MGAHLATIHFSRSLLILSQPLIILFLHLQLNPTSKSWAWREVSTDRDTSRTKWVKILKVETRGEWREESEQDDAPAEFEASDDGSNMVEVPNGRGSRETSPSDVIALFSEDEEGDLRGQPGERATSVDDARL
jgi:hypothetical protein